MTSTPTKTPADTLHERYQPIRELGHGAQGRTFLAEDLKNSTRVVLKELDLGFIQRVELLDLFAREVRVLKKVRHPGIPRYIDDFTVSQYESDTKLTRYFLVQEYILGENLRELVRGGYLFDEQSVREFLEQMLKILDYLHTRNPPIIHRDIKPSNIIFQPEKTRYVLVDFGGVQQRLITATGSSTVVGTSGYVPMEQLMSRARPASDLYSLAATAVFLLSQRSPSDMLGSDGMTLDFRPYIHCSPGLTDLLGQMLAPIAEDRPQSAAEVREALLKLGPAPSQPIGATLAPIQPPAPNIPQTTDATGRTENIPMLARDGFQIASHIRVTSTSRRPPILRARVIKKPTSLRIIFPRSWVEIIPSIGATLAMSAFAGLLAWIPIGSISYALSVGEFSGFLLVELLLLAIAAAIGYGALLLARRSALKCLRPSIEIQNQRLHVLSRPTPKRVLRRRRIVHLRQIQGLGIIEIQPSSKHAHPTIGSYLMHLDIGPDDPILIASTLPIAEQLYLLGELHAFIHEKTDIYGDTDKYREIDA